MELLLRKQNLWKKVIIGDRPTPELSTAGVIENQKAIDDWDDLDDEARGTIGLLVEDDQLGHIRKAKTAKTTWEALKEYHEKDSYTNRTTLMRTICGMKLDEGGDAVTHINRMRDLFSRLYDLGEEQLSERWSSAMLLRSMPSSYDPLIIAIESRKEDEITFAMVQQRIISEYERRDVEKGGTSDSVLKTVAKVGSCYFCKNRGHQKKDCIKYKAWLAKQGNSHKGASGSGARSSDRVNTVDESNFLFLVGGTQRKEGWIVDSGATRHVVNNKAFFTKFDETYQSSVELANGQAASVNGIGTGTITFLGEDGCIRNAEATEVLYAPKLVGNVLSVRQLARNGFKVEFNQRNCRITYKGRPIGVADTKGELYVLRQPDAVCSVVAHNENCIHDLHRRMGHRDPIAIRKMASDGMIDGLRIVECGIKEVCDVCMKGKMARLPFPKKSSSESSATLDLIHTDVCGPMRTATPGGKRYFVTFIDDFSGFTFVNLLTHKSEVEDTTKQFIALCQNTFGRKPKVIRSDRGGEYTGKTITQFLKKSGIRIQLTAAYSPQQNGKAERKNRTLVEMARCMLIDADLPYTFWGEAIATANFIQNRVLTRTTNTTPYERWNGAKPGIDKFHIFGSKCFVHIPSEKRGKLDDVAIGMIFLGYDENSKAYRCYNKATRKLVISRDVRFSTPRTTDNEVSIDIEPVKHETRTIDGDKENACAEEEKHNITVSSENGDESYVDAIDTEPDVEEENASNEAHNDDTQRNVRVSQRSTKGIPPRRLIEEIHITKEVIEPKTYSDAISCDEAEQWLAAMQDEIESHKTNGTWELVDLPAGKKAIGGKWVFKAKTGADGELQRYKARYVAQGFSQKYGEDYDEVFAPVVLHSTFRTLLSVAAKRKLAVHHLDAKTAFLNGKLTETIYMRQPPGFECEGSKVCLLKKSIYGLKQAAKSWNDALHEVLEAADFRQSYNDPCLYSKKINDGYCYVIVYVDDLIVASSTTEQMMQIENIFKPHFRMQNLGPIRHYLGMEVTQDGEGNFELNQSAYIMKIASDFGLRDAKAARTPMEVCYGKSDTSQQLDNNTKYRQLIGRLLYLSVNTRPDISASVSILAQRVSNPSNEDWNQLKRVVRYLKSTHQLKLKLSMVQSDKLALFGYADATWADDRFERKSNSGRIIYFNGGTISWACNKQSMVASSSCEAEFISLCEASKEVKWLRQLLVEMHEPIESHTTIYEDNQSCIVLVRDHKFSYKTKHIDTRYKMIRDLVKKGIIDCEYCPTEEMVADLLTKPLSSIKHDYFRSKCNLV